MTDTDLRADAGDVKPGLHRLLGDAMRNSADLVQLEIELFKQEMAENISRLFIGLALLVAGAVFAIAALLLLVEAFVEWLATVVGSEALAALISGGVLLFIALAFMLTGRSMMSFDRLKPRRTARSLSRDASLISERVSS